jgi:hypothetical protein
MTTRSWLQGGSLAALVALVVACGGSSQPEDTACSYDGKTYDDGDSFPSTDGCNTCSCEAGSVLCTEKGCPSCEDISTLYGALMDQAKTCDPEQPSSCNQRVVEGLACSCGTFVNPENWDETAAQSLQDAYAAGDCGQGIVCGPCQLPVTATCSAEGRCVDVSEPTEGTACKVGGVVYPNGATEIPDPTSCNTCTCEDGGLVCTEIHCPVDCPEATQLGTSCAQCGPADDCEVLETDCLPSCSDSEPCDAGTCHEGVCAQLCG